MVGLEELAEGPVSIWRVTGKKLLQFQTCISRSRLLGESMNVPCSCHTGTPVKQLEVYNKGLTGLRHSPDKVH